MKEYIYLDNNATTQMDEEVVKTIQSTLSLGPLNPSSSHQWGRKAKALIEDARADIASFLGVSSQEILFASSGTECLNLFIHGLKSKNTQIVSTTIEHVAIDTPLKSLKKKGYPVCFIEPKNGQICPEQIQDALDTPTSFIILSWVNGETGAKTDIASIAEICAAKKVPLIVDAVALMGRESFSVYTGISGLVFSAHKFHGPKIGVAYISSSLNLSPLITGGHQEHQLRAGTEDVANIVGAQKAISLLQKYLPKETKKMQELRDFFEHSLQSLINIKINAPSNRICNVSNVSIENIDAEELLFYLNRQKICASIGSACASQALQPSRVLQEMGYSKERILSSIRFSLSRMTTKNEITQTITALEKFLRA